MNRDKTNVFEIFNILDGFDVMGLGEGDTANRTKKKN